MSYEYVENRIKEALRLSGGHPLKARQQILAWCYEDPKLLHGLTRPHLDGIAAYAINRVIHKQTAEEPEGEGLDVDSLAGEALGKDLLKAFVGRKGDDFGRSTGLPSSRRKRASQSHIDAIHLMSKKNQDKTSE